MSLYPTASRTIILHIMLKIPLLFLILLPDMYFDIMLYDINIVLQLAFLHKLLLIFLYCENAMLSVLATNFYVNIYFLKLLGQSICTFLRALDTYYLQKDYTDLFHQPLPTLCMIISPHNVANLMRGQETPFFFWFEFDYFINMYPSPTVGSTFLKGVWLARPGVARLSSYRKEVRKNMQYSIEYIFIKYICNIALNIYSIKCIDTRNTALKIYYGWNKQKSFKASTYLSLCHSSTCALPLSLKNKH